MNCGWNSNHRLTTRILIACVGIVPAAIGECQGGVVYTSTEVRRGRLDADFYVFNSGFQQTETEIFPSTYLQDRTFSFSDGTNSGGFDIDTIGAGFLSASGPDDSVSSLAGVSTYSMQGVAANDGIGPPPPRGYVALEVHHPERTFTMTGFVAPMDTLRFTIYFLAFDTGSNMLVQGGGSSLIQGNLAGGGAFSQDYSVAGFLPSLWGLGSHEVFLQFSYQMEIQHKSGSTQGGDFSSSDTSASWARFDFDADPLPGIEIPEPASLTLFGLGALSLAGAARRHREAV